MSFEAACGAALLRSAVIAACAVPLAGVLLGRLKSLSHRGRACLWAAAFTPFVAPTLLVAYAYSGFAMALSASPLLDALPNDLEAPCRAWIAAHDQLVNEAVLCLALLSKSVPVALVVRAYAPAPPVSPEALYCRRLLLGRGARWGERLSLAWLNAAQGPARNALAAGLLAGVLTFQEFELVARLGRPSWTVWLFDAQAFGVPLAVSIRKALAPAGLQALLLLPLFWRASAGGRWSANRKSDARQPRGAAILAMGILAMGLIAGCLTPLVMLSASIPAGLVALWKQQPQLWLLARQALTGLLVAAAAAAAAWWALSACGAESNRAGRGRGWVLLVACLPGASGPLVVSLLVVLLFQQTWLFVLQGTFLPWIIAQAFWVFPRALLLRLLLTSMTDAASVHAGRLLGDATRAARGLRWRLEGMPRFVAASLLAWWCYLELTTSQLLSPPGMASAPVTLYIQMHYGRNDVLTVMTLLTVLIPLVAVLAVLGSAPAFVRWYRR